MVEVSNLGTGTPGGTSFGVGVSAMGTAGIPAVLYPISTMFSAGLEAQSAIGTTSLSGTDVAPVSHGGSVYLANLTQIVAAGGGGSGLSLAYGTTTLTGVNEIVLGTGLSLAGSSPTGTIAATGGGGSTSLPLLPGIGDFLSSAGVWQRPAASTFTSYTSGVAATLTDVTNGPIKVSASTADKTIAGVAVTPGANFTFEVLFSINGRSDIADELGIVVGDTSSGNGLQFIIGSSALPRLIFLQEITNITTGGTYSAEVGVWSPVASPALYTMKFQLVGTNTIGAYVALDPVDPTLGYYPWGSQAVGSGDFIPQINFAGILIEGNSSGIDANLNIWGYRITYP